MLVVVGVETSSLRESCNGKLPPGVPWRLTPTEVSLLICIKEQYVPYRTVLFIITFCPSAVVSAKEAYRGSSKRLCLSTVRGKEWKERKTRREKRRQEKSLMDV